MRTIPLVKVKASLVINELSINQVLSVLSDIHFLMYGKCFYCSLFRVNNDDYNFYGRFSFPDCTVSFYGFLKSVIL